MEKSPHHAHSDGNIKCQKTIEGWKQMNILVGFNDSYAVPTQVMLKSLIENNNCTIDIYVLYILLSDASKKLLLSLKSKRVNIYYIQVKESDFDNVPVMDGYSKEAYIRLFAHTYLPENVERILWLDGDLIINGPINEYYDQSFDGKLYIADRDFDHWDGEYQLCEIFGCCFCHDSKDWNSKINHEAKCQMIYHR